MVLDNSSGVVQARQDLLTSLRPSLGLLRALRLVAKPVRNRVLLVQVSLQSSDPQVPSRDTSLSPEPASSSNSEYNRKVDDYDRIFKELIDAE